MTALQKGSAAIPEADKDRIPPTSKDECDEALAILRDHADEWAKLAIDERIEILQALVRTTEASAERWVEAGCEAKGIRRGTPAEGEEWLGGPSATLRNLQLLITSLRDVRDTGTPQLPGKPTVRPDGQVVAPVFPTDKWDKLLFAGFTAEVWMDPSVTASSLKDTMAVFYKQAAPEGKVALILGAGNVSSIGPMDALYKLFAEGEVCLLKMNPVNEYLGPIIETAFRELIRRGYMRVVYGGAAEGDYLCRHDMVDSIHITGSDKTHDAIVWGVGQEGDDRKRRGEPRNDKPISSELGNVSPFIIVPGPWTQGEVDFHGANLASSLVNNAGFNCNATRVVITHKEWDQRADLLAAMRKSFGDAGERLPYYPGAEQRHAAFLAAHPKAHQVGPSGEGRVPWTLVEGLDPSKADDMCFTTEAWCGVTSEAPLSAASTVEYIQKAVEFANDTCWGTLSASIVVHPKSLKDPQVAAAVEQAIADLRFGTVVVNHWAAIGYGMVATTWGAFPGHELTDVRSGRGVVHNTFLFDRPQKSVIRGPFKMFPKPAWFVNNKTCHEIGRKMTAMNADPSYGKLASLVFSAVRG